MVLSLDRWIGKVAVVTGASSGIGAAIAEQLVEKGLKVVGLARRKERLDELAKKVAGKKGKFYPFQTDLTKEQDILNAFKWIKENVGPVHVLVNNAGIGGNGKSLHEGDTERWRQIIDTNVIALCIATREAVKDMKANNVDGHIIHINSVAGHQVLDFPGASVYPASKFAVTALAETLRLELNSLKSKIKITNISPGPVDTEIFPEYFKELVGYDKLVESKVFIESENIADAVTYVLSTPPLFMERKILRTIMGAKRIDEEEYRQLMNHEIEEMMGKENIVRIIKSMRIRWYGHILRREENSTLRRITEWNPGYGRTKGRPKKRWKEQVEKDITELKVDQWQTKITDRKKWKKIVHQAKTHRSL